MTKSKFKNTKVTKTPTIGLWKEHMKGVLGVLNKFVGHFGLGQSSL